MCSNKNAWMRGCAASSLLACAALAAVALPLPAPAGAAPPAARVIGPSIQAAIQAAARAPGATRRVTGPSPTEFDAPHATTEDSSLCAPNCGTIAFANNDQGVVVGFYTDKNVVPHGFIREPNGKIHEFDAPGAGLGHGLNEGTVAYAVNNQSVVAGEFEDPQLVFHAFVRDAAGAFTVFDAPGAGTGAGQGTVVYNINTSGATSGVYIDTSGVYHGFLSAPGGPVTGFDPAGSVYTQVCLETCHNDAGAIVGYFVDAGGVYHGFLREPDGSITQIDAPGALQASNSGTLAASINADGEITGYYYDANGVGHGFLRYPKGRYVTFDAPKSNAAGTYAFSVNYFGAVTGATSVFDGFERLPDGSTETFIAPDAVHEPGFHGTRPSTLNITGEVAGFYIDAAGLVHGFVWNP